MNQTWSGTLLGLTTVAISVGVIYWVKSIQNKKEIKFVQNINDSVQRKAQENESNLNQTISDYKGDSNALEKENADFVIQSNFVEQKNLERISSERVKIEQMYRQDQGPKILKETKETTQSEENKNQEKLKHEKELEKINLEMEKLEKERREKENENERIEKERVDRLEQKQLKKTKKTVRKRTS